MSQFLSYRAAFLALAATLLCLPSSAQNNGSLLNPVFQDGAVLQRNQPIQVWGTASPSDTVSVVMDEKTGSTTVRDDGTWSLRLPSFDVGGPHQLLVVGAHE